MFEKLQSIADKYLYHFSHDDLDGYTPQVLTRVASLDPNVIFKHCGYGNFEKELEKQIEIFEDKTWSQLVNLALLITDIAPKDKELLERIDSLHSKGLTVVLLDHHDTAKWIQEDYPHWAFVSSELNERVTAASEIYYEYLKEKGILTEYIKNNVILNDFIEQVRQYDTWAWEANDNLLAKDLNTLFFSLQPVDFVSNQVEKIYDSMSEYSAFHFNGLEDFIVQLENTKESEYIKQRESRIVERVWNVSGKSYTAGIVFGDNYHSTMGNVLHKKNPHLDMLAILDMNKGKGSLRTIHDNIHVGEIAKAMLGGGGHQKAAGFQFNNTQGIQAIESTFGVLVK